VRGNVNHLHLQAEWEEATQMEGTFAGYQSTLEAIGPNEPSIAFGYLALAITRHVLYGKKETKGLSHHQ